MVPAKMHVIKKIMLLFLFLSLFPAYSCSNRQTVYKKSKPLMDTIVTITVVSDSAEKAGRAIENAFNVTEKFGDLINFFSDGSELSSINRNAGIRKVKVSPHALDVIEKAIYIAEKSNGAFDPTIGPEIRLWDFEKKKLPSDDEIRKNLPFVNYHDIIVDGKDSTVFLRKKGMLMDLGGTAKGYAADLAVESLKRDGIVSGIVANAGDIRTFGLKPDGKGWTIGIKNPRQTNESDEIIGRIILSGKAISTSGDYERYFISAGRRYHHILDPSTGYPADGCRSVTVITDKGVFTDGFSTALFVLGPEKGMRLAREMGLEAIIIDSAGKLSATAGLKGQLKLEKSN